MNLKWVTLINGQWADLETVDLSSVNSFGVYVIWNSNRVVRVGQGDISKRLFAHRNDRDILRHRENGLYVIWASVPSHSVDGVERYLFDLYKPIVGERSPNVSPITVNLPR
jgi:hypothetical protein